MSRYIVKESARQEVAETFGEGFSISVLVLVDQSRSCRWFAPMGMEASVRIPLFDDQVEEAR